MNIRKMFAAIAVFAASINGVFAQQTYEEMERLTVNEQVTTVITATEPIRICGYFYGQDCRRSTYQ